MALAPIALAPMALAPIALAPMALAPIALAPMALEKMTSKKKLKIIEEEEKFDIGEYRQALSLKIKDILLRDQQK